MASKCPQVCFDAVLCGIYHLGRSLFVSLHLLEGKGNYHVFPREEREYLDIRMLTFVSDQFVHKNFRSEAGNIMSEFSPYTVA